MPNLEALDTTYGALFIALILGTILYGIALLQTFLYYRQYPNDPWSTKSIVFLLWALDTAHVVLCTITIYSHLISNYNNPIVLHQSSWSMNLQVDCNGLIGIIVQCFFARRVLIVSKNMFLTVIIIAFACVHFSLGVVFTVKAFTLADTDSFSKLIWIAATGLGSAAAADVTIAAALCYYLGKSRTGFARTDSLITTLIIYSLTTGLITSFIALICVVTFAAMPTNLIWIGFFWIIGKFYVNSLLATLNGRDSLREKLTEPQNTVLHLTALGLSATSRWTAEPSSAGSGMDKDTPYIDSPVLAMNVQKLDPLENRP